MIEGYLITGYILAKEVSSKEEASKLMNALDIFLNRKLHDLGKYYYYAIKNDIMVWGIVNEISIVPNFPYIDPESLTMYGWFKDREDIPDFKWQYQKESSDIKVEFTFYRR